MPDTYRNIRALLSSRNSSEMQNGLRLIAIEITNLGSSEARPLFEMVTSLFYIDVLDHPEFIPAVDEAVNLAASFGEWAIPILIEDLTAGDIKAQWAIANVLGRIGAAAIDPMIKEYGSKKNPSVRAFILYALGKIKSPQITKAIPLVCEASGSECLEMRDTATRALGKFVECIPPAALPSELKQRILRCLHENLSDENASVRSKSVRSLGKLAKYGHMTEMERTRLKTVCDGILGIDEKREWDRAFIVRKEAEEACSYL